MISSIQGVFGPACILGGGDDPKFLLVPLAGSPLSVQQLMLLVRWSNTLTRTHTYTHPYTYIHTHLILHVSLAGSPLTVQQLMLLVIGGEIGDIMNSVGGDPHATIIPRPGGCSALIRWTRDDVIITQAC